MTLAELPLGEIRRRLRSDLGLRLGIGPFAVALRTTVRDIPAALCTLYADFPVVDEAAFVDFHLELDRPRGLRRWLAPQVSFSLDGRVPFKPLPLAHAPALQEWALNWCIYTHAHQYLIIHAAVVARGPHALILSGPPGSGKSTLTAGLIHDGWRLLSDELALVLRDGSTRIQPLARPVGLKNDAIGLIQARSPGAAFGPLARDTLKGTIAHLRPPSESVTRAHEMARAAWVVFPRFAPDSDTRLEGVPRAQAFLELARNSFNYDLLGVRGFDCLADLIEGSSTHSLVYGNLDQALRELAALPKSEPEHVQRATAASAAAPG
ncbi:HprK-related kinase A [Sediminicurvatus halobius]|uniref:HprK-related kinase A n=1 Tax=Sediminicurvatus halobius TaxID=2182432 RepID=A0A2U2MXD0_9GAMM|nr:HprK-related kinase A [Spiribacter halobius]PWG61456.1 HprK-related kinase A [Spiribacter halobius]UEX77241.1 HprK-related kinase A [Spiribacter halobius]